VFGVGALFVQADSPAGDNAAGISVEPSKGPGATVKHHTAGLSADTLGVRVRELLSARSGTGSESLGSQSSPNTPMMTSTPPLPSCVKAGTGRSEPPLAVQQDTYDGTPAYVVLLPHPGDPSLVDAYVVSSACVGASPSSAGDLLVTHTYPHG
jgi:hypothetical protein